MKNEIIDNINNPIELEKLYRKDMSAFIKSFNELYPDFSENATFQFWNIRLNYKVEKVSLSYKKELYVVFLLAIVAGLFANISNIFKINKELFFQRNTSFLIIPFLVAYFFWKQKISKKIMITLVSIIIFFTIYVNLIPNLPQSSSVDLIYIHIPLLGWFMLGFAYLGNEYLNNNKRITYLKYNGELILMSAIILLSCLCITILTIGLFDLIGMNIEKFYMQNIAIWEIGAIPIFATFLVQNNPQLINKISPLIAKIFTPIVFVTLFIYLITIIYKGKYAYNDRNLLLVYNLLLVLVLALIFYSIAENENKKITNLLLILGMSLLTIFINALAVSAILFRILEWGFTPNRVAVLGWNCLIFLHVLFVCYNLINVVRKKTEVQTIKNTIAKYLPIYAIWALIIVLLFPFIFNWK